MFDSCFNNLKIFKNIFLNLPHFTIPGMNSCIQQRCVLGQYSFLAMLNPQIKNAFPFFIHINNKPKRMNYKRVPVRDGEMR